MSNKSRRRILHEQRVEIARLNREIEDWRRAMERARWNYDPTKTIQYSQIIRNDAARNERDALFNHVSERVIRDMVRLMVASNVMQITTDTMQEIDATRVTLKLNFLVPEHTGIKPAEVFKNVERIDFREPEIIYGGPRRDQEMYCRQRDEEYMQIMRKYEYGLINPFRRDDERIEYKAPKGGAE